MKSYYDIKGDGGSDVLQQVAERRAQIDARFARIRNVVAIGSGKGGVGKSTLTMQIAGALRSSGMDVAILDADLNGPSQARLGGVRGVPLIPGGEGLSLPRTESGIGVVSMGSLFPETQNVDFESVASGDSFVWRATKEFSVLGELLATVAWGDLDYLLLDLPPGAERTLQYAEFLGERAAFVLVTIPSDLARGVVTRSIAALEQVDARILGYIENMRGYYCPDCDSLKPLFPETGNVDLPVPRLGSVPFDPELSALSDAGAFFADDDERPSIRAIRNVTIALEAAIASD